MKRYGTRFLAILVTVAIAAVTPAEAGQADQGAGQEPQGPWLDDLLPPEPEMRAHFDVAVEMVRVPVIVEGPMGGFVPAMAAGDFRIVDGSGPAHRVEHLVADDAPGSVGILVDGSADAGELEEAMRRALGALVGSLRQGDEAFLVRFADEVELLAPFSDSREELLDDAGGYAAAGGSGRALHDALALGLIRMRRARHDKRALVVLADGGDRGSEVDPADLREAARRDGVAIHAIVLREQEPRWRDRLEEEPAGEHDAEDHAPVTDEVKACRADAPSSTACLQQLSRDTGGLVAVRPGVEERFGGLTEWLRRAAVDVGAYVRRHYVLVYQPRSLPPRGTWRRLAVRVGVPFSRIRARTGYVR
ncbi:MAG: VWA domain-containing protein [Acidobacteriota bacterium]